MSASVSLKKNVIQDFFREILESLQTMKRKKIIDTIREDCKQIEEKLNTKLADIIEEDYDNFLFEYNGIFSGEIVDAIWNFLKQNGYKKDENDIIIQSVTSKKEIIPEIIHIVGGYFRHYFQAYIGFNEIYLEEKKNKHAKLDKSYEQYFPLNKTYLKDQETNDEPIEIKTSKYNDDKKLYNINLIKNREKIIAAIITPTVFAFETMIPSEIKHDFLGSKGSGGKRSDMSNEQLIEIIKMINLILPADKQFDYVRSEENISKLFIEEYLPWASKPTFRHDGFELLRPEDSYENKSVVVSSTQNFIKMRKEILLSSDATPKTIDSVYMALTNKNTPLLKLDSGNPAESRSSKDSTNIDTIPEILIGDFVKIVYSADNKDKPFIVSVLNVNTKEYFELGRIKDISVTSVYDLYNKYLISITEEEGEITTTPVQNLQKILSINDDELKNKISSVIVYILLIKEIADIIYLIALIIEMNTKFHMMEYTDNNSTKKNYDLGIVASGDYGLIQSPLIDIKIDNQDIDFELLQVVAVVHIHNSDVLLPVTFMQKFITILLIIMENMYQLADNTEKGIAILNEIKEKNQLYEVIVNNISAIYIIFRNFDYLDFLNLEETIDNIKTTLSLLFKNFHFKTIKDFQDFPDIEGIQHTSEIVLPDIFTFIVYDYNSINYKQLKQIENFISFLQKVYDKFGTVYGKEYNDLFKFVIVKLHLYHNFLGTLHNYINTLQQDINWTKIEAKKFLELFNLKGLETVTAPTNAYLFVEFFSRILLNSPFLIEEDVSSSNKNTEMNDEIGYETAKENKATGYETDYETGYETAREYPRFVSETFRKRKLSNTGGKKTIKRKNNKKHKKTIKRNSNNNKKSIKKKYYKHNITR